MNNKRIRVGVLGAGGLGKAAAKIIGMKKEMILTAICDRGGILFNKNGLDTEAIFQLNGVKSVVDLPGGEKTSDSISEVINRADSIDGIFIALPNLPNNFNYEVTKKFIDAGASCIFTDALKRTSAVKMMFGLENDLKKIKSVYLIGCGATPGLLSSAAVLAAQSFVEIEKVDIYWGVGISNWDAYKATIREDIAHLPGYDVEKAKAMTDEEVEKLLDKTNGRLELQNMEHADDILLERIGLFDGNGKVSVGGIMDTRSAKKPVSTTMTLTGTTFEGKKSSHKFILGDETSMAANVIGTALGYLKRGIWLKEHGIYGIFGSTEFMPMVVN
jgi:hypothetical protein